MGLFEVERRRLFIIGSGIFVFVVVVECWLIGVYFTVCKYPRLRSMNIFRQVELLCCWCCCYWPNNLSLSRDDIYLYLSVYIDGRRFTLLVFFKVLIFVSWSLVVYLAGLLWWWVFTVYWLTAGFWWTAVEEEKKEREKKKGKAWFLLLSKS